MTESISDPALAQTVMTMMDLVPVIALLLLAWSIRTTVNRVSPDAD